MVASVTVTVTGNVPVAPGVPVMVPAAGSMTNGDGSPVALQAKGLLPPEAATGALYATPTTPLGSDAVVIARTGAIVNDNCLEAVRFVGVVESVTVMLTVNVPLEPGVPVIAPEVALMANGDGSPVALQANGVLPPEAATGALYAKPTAPLGSDAVVIARTGAIVNENCLEAVRFVGVVESVTVMLTVNVPLEPGVPVIAPEVVLMANGDGSPVADHVNGVVPPVATTVVLYARPTAPLGSAVVVNAKPLTMTNDNCLEAV